MIRFWTLWIFVAAVAILPLFIFATAIKHKRIQLGNLGKYVMFAIIMPAILIGTYLLKANEEVDLANKLLLVISIPTFFLVLVFCIPFFTKGRWN
jgi:hypothetical protein